MTIKWNKTPEDALNDIVNTVDDDLWDQLQKRLFIIFSVLLFFVAIVCVVLAQMITGNSWIRRAVWAPFLVAILFRRQIFDGLIKYFGSKEKRRIRDSMDELKFGNCSLETTPEGLLYKFKYTSRTHPWENVSQVQVTDAKTTIRVGEEAIYIVPHAKVFEGDISAFRTEILRIINKTDKLEQN